MIQKYAFLKLIILFDFGIVNNFISIGNKKHRKFMCSSFSESISSEVLFSYPF